MAASSKDGSSASNAAAVAHEDQHLRTAVAKPSDHASHGLEQPHAEAAGLREATCALPLAQAELLKDSTTADTCAEHSSSQGQGQSMGNQMTPAEAEAAVTWVPCMHRIMGSPEQHFRCLNMLLKARLTMQSSEHDTLATYIASYGDMDPNGCHLLAHIMAKLSQCSYDGCGPWGFLRACARCKMTRYCNGGCQNAHYPAHKKHCKKPRQQHAR